MRLYLTPELGRLRLAGQLGPARVQRLHASLLARGLRASTVRRVHAALHRALAQAVSWRLVSVNVADLADPPQAARKEMAALTPPQVRAFLDEANGERLEALFALAVTAGLRRGELLALRWADIDLDSGRPRDGVLGANPWPRRDHKSEDIAIAAACGARRHGG